MLLGTDTITGTKSSGSPFSTFVSHCSAGTHFPEHFGEHVGPAHFVQKPRLFPLPGTTSKWAMQ